MPERNPCIASGCPGLCCQDRDLELTKFERSRLFPHAVRVNTMRELAELKNGKIPGVFYTRYRKKHLGESGFVVAILVGPCPNRAPDGSCIKHEEREHAARNWKFGSDECNAVRVAHKLAFVSIMEANYEHGTHTG